MSLMQLTAVELGKKIKAGEVSVVEATEAALNAIEAKEDKVNSFVTVDREGALKQAKEVQKKIDAGELTSPLAGVPVAIKDNMCTEGHADYLQLQDSWKFCSDIYIAEAVLNLEKAGAVILGKTNMDEFAMGSYHRDICLWRDKKSHGIQSMYREDLPADPVRLLQQRNASMHLVLIPAAPSVSPASFCGVTGIKPTYGTVSRYGLIAYGSSLDQIGPVAKDVTDCATILEAIASHDPKDSTSV